MNKEEMKAWESTRSKGMLKYILINGLLAWGLPMFIAIAFMNKPFAEGITSKAAIVHCVVWPLAGLVFGAITWYISQFRYKKAAKSLNQTNT
ncbi:hypothetical protein [Shewanella halifaxensis]|uniref:hypothetical protein n=1 Tax=Shewanella halifaxensis TaxID=271098 RepID=UPI000D591F03|nr:hypothetical protein [Shewanella halifaxensis]